jgi:protein-tyrosine phosphatase
VHARHGLIVDAPAVTDGRLPGTRPVFRLLFVCTGNICRSAAAERFARQAFDELGGVGRRVGVRSAGTRAVVGRPCTRTPRRS